MAVTVGQTAPDFELPDTEANPVKLSSFRGRKNVLLTFFPAAFSTGCQSEFCTLRDDNADLVGDDTVEIIGISTDNRWSLRAWKAAENFQHTFVSDFWPHGAVAGEYGALVPERGVALRHTFLIDKEGVVRYVETNSAAELRDQSAWRKALAELA